MSQTKNICVGERSTLQQNRSDRSKDDSDSEVSPADVANSDSKSNEADAADSDSKSKEADAADSDSKNNEHSLQSDPKTVFKSQDNKNNKLKNLLLCISVMVLPFIGVVLFYTITNNERIDVDKIWENGLKDLQLNFTGQTERFWKILKHRGLAHLRTKQPSRPLVFLMAAVPNAHDEVDCLATKLAELLDPDQKNNLTKISGRQLQNKPGGETKKIMDDVLCETFTNRKRVAIVYHLHLLPPPSPILFYSYCDDQNAPHKHVAMVFTVHLPRAPDPSLSPVEAAGSVEEFLQQEVWTDSPYNHDEIPALLSRIADTVLVMNSSDKNASLKTFCGG